MLGEGWGWGGWPEGGIQKPSVFLSHTPPPSSFPKARPPCHLFLPLEATGAREEFPSSSTRDSGRSGDGSWEPAIPGQGGRKAGWAQCVARARARAPCLRRRVGLGTGGAEVGPQDTGPLGARYCSPGVPFLPPCPPGPPASPTNPTWTMTLKPSNSPYPLNSVAPSVAALNPCCPRPAPPLSGPPPSGAAPSLSLSLPGSCPNRLGGSVWLALSPRLGVREKGRLHFPNREVAGNS